MFEDMVCYHITSVSNAINILQHGLLLKYSKSAPKGNYLFYLEDGFQNKVELAAKALSLGLLYSRYFVLLKVEIKKEKLIRDEFYKIEQENICYCTCDIPPQNITLSGVFENAIHALHLFPDMTNEMLYHATSEMWAMKGDFDCIANKLNITTFEELQRLKEQHNVREFRDIEND
jgi:hypothetical protein